VFIRSIGGPSNVNTGTGKDLVVIGSRAGAVDQDQSKLNDGATSLFQHGFLTVDGGDDDATAESVDTIEVHDEGDSEDNVGSVTPGGVTGLGIGESSAFIFTRFQKIDVRLGSGNDRLFVEDTPLGSTVISLGGGTDIVNVESISGVTTINGGDQSNIFNVNFDIDGRQTFENGIAAELTLNGEDGGDSYNVGLAGQGSSEINVFDNGAAGIDDLEVFGTNNGDYFLLRASKQRLDSNGNVLPRVGMVAAIEVDEAGDPREGGGIERINYNAEIEGGLVIQGRAGDDTFILDDNLASTTINGDQGNDRFQVGQIFASPRDETNLNHGLAPRDFFETTAVTQGFLSNGVSESTILTGGIGDDVFTVYRNLAELSLFGNEDDDQFTVRAFVRVNPDDPQAPHTNINGGQGADFIAFTVDAPVRIDGGDGFDTITIVGTEFGDDFVVTESGVFGAGKFVTFTGVEKLTVDALEGNDRFFIVSTSDKVQVEIIGGLGSDTFNIGGGEGGDDGEITVVSNNLKGHSGLVVNTWNQTASSFPAQFYTHRMDIKPLCLYQT